MPSVKKKWVLLSCLGGLLACDSIQEEAPTSTLAQTEQKADSVELETNLLQGTVRITNQNPAILSWFATNPWRKVAGVSASSTSPGGFTASSHTALDQFTGTASYTFEMLVEAGAGGDAGVVYNVNSHWAGYNLPTVQGVRVKPRRLQPDPTVVDIQSCVGLVEFHLGTDETCQTPVAVDGFSVHSIALFPQSPGVYAGLITGGASFDTQLRYSLTTSAGTITTVVNVPVSAACDEVVRICTPVRQDNSRATGSLTGPIEVQGQALRNSSVALYDPNNNSTRRVAPSTHPAPILDPSTWWRFSDVYEGTYWMTGTLWLNGGRDFSVVTLPWVYPSSTGPVQVVGGQTVTPTKQVDGRTRHAFVMNPSFFYGSVRLADPSVPLLPGSRSSLQALYFEADHDSNGDGVPNSPAIGGRSTALHTEEYSGDVWTGFPGSFMPATGELLSTYQQPLTNPYDLPRRWTQSYLALRFWSEGYSRATKPGLYDPVLFRYGSLFLQPPNGTATLAPEQRFRIDHEYCFNEVQVQYTTELGRLYNPKAALNGSFNGTDWRGKAAAYTTQGEFYGIPAVWSVGDDARQFAQPSGSVSMALPQGSYTLTPSATMVSDSGVVNNATFAPINVTLGCGQRLKLVPPLAVVLPPLQGCASSGEVPVSGVVKSAPAVVDRIWYRVNGGAEVTLCTHCGQDPSFSFTAPLQACDNTIEVFAFTEGMPEPATSVQRLVWDDPADGPSCAGAYCVNQPPVARCRNVIVDATSAGTGCASVNDGSYDPDDGAVSCVQSPGCDYPLGNNKVTLTCTDEAGLTGSCEATVTVRDSTPLEVTCPAEAALVCTEQGAQGTYSVEATSSCATAVTCSPPSGSLFPVGTTTVSCTAMDCRGNTASCSFPVTVEKACPPPPKVTLCTKPAYTQATTMEVCAYVTPGSGGAPLESIAFSVNGGAPIPVTPAPQDMTSGLVKTTVALQDGPNEVQIVARNASGYVTVQKQTIVVDRVAPTIQFLSPVDGQALATQTVTVRSSIQDVGPTTVTTGASATSSLPAGGGTAEATLPPFTTKGLTSISVTARDAAGNSFKRTISVLLDWDAPTVATTLADGATVSSANINYGLRVFAKAATTVTFSHLPGQQFTVPRNGGSLSVPMSLQAGANTFTITVVSEAGLRSTLTRTVNRTP
jgi:hypothetical protein